MITQSPKVFSEPKSSRSLNRRLESSSDIPIISLINSLMNLSHVIFIRLNTYSHLVIAMKIVKCLPVVGT